MTHSTLKITPIRPFPFVLHSHVESHTADHTKQVRTNTYLPPATCGELAVDEKFDADKTRECIKDWLGYPTEAAYGEALVEGGGEGGWVVDGF